MAEEAHKHPSCSGGGRGSEPLWSRSSLQSTLDLDEELASEIAQFNLGVEEMEVEISSEDSTQVAGHGHDGQGQATNDGREAKEDDVQLTQHWLENSLEGDWNKSTLENDRKLGQGSLKNGKETIQGGSTTRIIKKEHVNIVFIGHVDAGKSTIGGQLMYLNGTVNMRTLDEISHALDTSPEERERSKTVELGRGSFETEKRHFSILDAPGHRGLVPNMISGATQADLAVLVISARRGEFETGFEGGGQTREHTMLVKSAGVKFLVVLINKMDDQTVDWSEARFNECRDKLIPYLKRLGFKPTDMTFIPCSGRTGAGLKEFVDTGHCSWYTGLPFISFVDALPCLERNLESPFILPIVGKFKDMGIVVTGKVESGKAIKGHSLILMPNQITVTIDMMWANSTNDVEATAIYAGEIVKIRLKGIEEQDVSPGFVLCDPKHLCKVSTIFDAHVAILECKRIICAGYSAVMHIHCAVEEITVEALFCLVDKKTGEKSKTRPRFVKENQVAIMRLKCAGAICLEPYKLCPQMGRFTLRDEGKTVAIGKVLKIIE